jgi:phenylpropionate dioxygenase-like ring-hydroxylating dioxygenase large terminal subunit
VYSAKALDIAKRALGIAEGEPELSDAFLKVPMEYYFSERYVLRERSIFHSTPLVIAHCDQVPQPNDYMVREAYGKSLLITRNRQGQARVFFNTCRHRGAEPAAGTGNRRHFACPYHGWVYNNDGNLVSLPLQDRYDGLDLSTMGLFELPCEERHGFIWVILDPEACIDVAAHLGELDGELADWGFGDLKYMGAPADVELEANWKATGEGFLEGLHVPFVHRGTFDRYTDVQTESDRTGFNAIGPHVRLFYINPPQLMGTLHGGEFAVNVRNFANVVYWIFPNLVLANTPTEQGGTIFISFFPGDHVQHTRLRAGFLAPDPAGSEEMVTFQKEQSELAKSSIVNEDVPILASCGRGFSNGYGHATIGRNEPGVQGMIKSLATQIGCPLTQV